MNTVPPFNHPLSQQQLSGRIETQQINKQPPPDSEIDRERRRLTLSVDALLAMHEELWKRLHAVVSPPPPIEAKGMAIEGCDSNLGNFLQTEATRVSGAVESVRYLLDSLRL